MNCLACGVISWHWEQAGRLNDVEVLLHEALRLYQKIGAAGHARRLEAELAVR